MAEQVRLTLKVALQTVPSAPDNRNADMPRSHNQRVGRWGEGYAAQYLEAHGFEVTARNVRTPYGEIDLIAGKDGLTVFVEVKTRLSAGENPPETSVTGRKQGHMTDCAEYYAQQHELDRWRIDVIAVQRLADRTEVVHFENAVT